MKRTLDSATLTIESYKHALLTAPDPQIADKPLLRVPLGEGTDIGFSAQDWTNAWRAGSIDFTDQYYLAHKGKPLPKDDLDKLQTYIYLNRLDPMVVQNWNAAYDRLVAAGVIKPEAPKPPVKPPVQEEEQEPQGRRWIDVEKMSSRTPDERNALKSAMYNNIMIEAQPVVDQFFADLETQGHYLTTDEKLRLQAWVYEHSLFPHQRVSWETALNALMPQYLDTESRAVRELDRDDTHTSARLKKYFGSHNNVPVAAYVNRTRDAYVPPQSQPVDTKTLIPAQMDEHQRLNDLDQMSTADYKRKWGQPDPAVNRR